MNLQVGQTLGKYRIEAEIGRGGMGIVYRGYDPVLRRPVAIKVLSPQLTHDTEFVQRFRQEAILAASLRHPGIVTIHDVGQQGDTHYMVMEYLEGETLETWLRRQGPLRVAQAAQVVGQIAAALDYAHSKAARLFRYSMMAPGKRCAELTSGQRPAMAQHNNQSSDTEITTPLPLARPATPSSERDTAGGTESAQQPGRQAIEQQLTSLVDQEVSEPPTPPYLPAIAPPRRDAPGQGAGLAVAALICALLALAAVGALTWRLTLVGRSASNMLDNAISQLESVCGTGARPFTFVFSETVRFKGEVPLPEGIAIPFKGNIPINTVVRIQVSGFPGSPVLEVPINTTVPVDTRVPVPGGIVIPIDTAVPIRQEIPVDLCGNTFLAMSLERVVQDLRTWRDLMRFP